MNSLHYVILFSVSKMQGERTMNGIIHILRGKRSAQTIQDISLYSCEQWAALLKNIPILEVNRVIHTLFKVRTLEENRSGGVELTDEGKRKLDYLSKKYQIPNSYEGLKYDWTNVTPFFWEQLALLIQTISYLNERESTFIPVSYSKDVQRAVRDILSANKNYQNLGSQLYAELEKILNDRSDQEAAVFVNKLTSFQRVGRTFEQLSSTFHDDPLYTSIVFRSIIHQMISHSQCHPVDFPVLASLLTKSEEDTMITKTAAVTKTFIEKGFSLNEIAERRNLKASTIEDHMVELAIHDPYFSIDSFLSSQEFTEIREWADKLNTRKMKLIKDKVGDKYSYFQIRLAISSRKGVH
ncbi:hypothetical protein CR194_02775 [Salipaludibacillus keqinensis]|uniref:Helicase Helix-turn-helix domain-containing protein n=1 Tax=Salipaludibacillus keqinensis TaxID=2045207 RepID=A0A323TP68_9BACI|nr:helix-turn-helix domain-containing protein [Salipaludibacillus keqinensis]PYZ94473.1 hypothetical protein CR194_02775 [Salipaludibacillus keqinensis]